MISSSAIFASAFLLLHVIAPSAAASASRVTQFNVINVRTGAFVRRLRNDDVLDNSYPFAIVAIAPGARRVTFVSPWRVVDNGAPFAIPRDVVLRRFHPLRLNPGKRTVSAYADDNSAAILSVTFTVRRRIEGTPSAGPPPLPNVGPLPSDVSPYAFAKNVEKAPIPLIKPGCSRKTVPKISNFVVGRSYYHFGESQLDFKVDWCAGDHAIRLRILSFEYVKSTAGSYFRRTKVLASQTATFVQYGSTQLLFTSCKPQQIYVEACAMRTGESPLCATSELKKLFAFTVSEPVLKYRPPTTLSLGRGDRPVMSYAINTTSDHGTPPRKYRLQIAAVAQNGRWLCASKWVSGTQISARLPLSAKIGEGVLPWQYDGAEVFLRFAYDSCPSNVATLREREKTTLVVKNSVSKLVKQDEALPKLEKLVYPQTVFGKPVALNIGVSNPGNGRRANGSRTTLQYQWFMRDFDFGFSPSYPNLLAGETGPMLKLSKAECETPSCGRHGCSDLKQYSVVVCNTLGCVRSNAVSPNIVPPPLQSGQKWNGYSCEIET